MFKRFSNQQLLIALAIISGVYLLSLVFGGASSRTFEETLAVVDTARVDQIIIHPPGQGEVKLLKGNPGWQVSLPGGKAAPVADKAVPNALRDLTLLEATQLVSRDESEWANYEVDSSGTRVQLLAGEETLLDIVLGKFTYRSTGMNFVRLQGENETYLVEGFLQSAFNKAANDWRNKTLISGGTTDWNQLTFVYPDTNFQVMKDTANQWVLADSTPTDHTAVNAYLSALGNLNGTEFVDEAISSRAAFTLSVQSASKGTIQLQAFPMDSSHFAIQSSLNPGAYFNGSADGLTNKIFVPKSRFLPQAETPDP